MLYSRLRGFRVKVDRAKKKIETFTKGGELYDQRNWQRSGGLTPKECYVSISWGKDSTVLAHLVASVIGTDATNAISIQYGTPHDNGEWTIEPFDRWPDLVKVKDDFLSSYPLNYYEAYVPSFWYLCEQYDCKPITVDMSGGGKNIGLVENIFVSAFERTIDTTAKELGFIGNLMGMRKEESNNRQRHFAMRGHTYYAKERAFWCCNPLCDWSGDDIWAYIVLHDLPYSELYDAQGFDRDTLRNGLMIGGGMMRYGAYVHFKRLYPGLWNIVCEKYPYLRAFA